MRQARRILLIALALALGVAVFKLYLLRNKVEALEDDNWRLECQSAFFHKVATNNAQEAGRVQSANRALNQIIEDMIEASNKQTTLIDKQTTLIDNQRMRILKLQEGTKP